MTQLPSILETPGWERVGDSGLKGPIQCSWCKRFLKLRDWVRQVDFSYGQFWVGVCCDADGFEHWRAHQVERALR